MRIFTEVIIDPCGDFLKEYNIKFASDSWSAHINLTEFILNWPRPKIAKVIKWITDGDSDRDVTSGFSILFECLDYLSKLTYNDDKRHKRFIKKLQALNDYAMFLQSIYNHNSQAEFIHSLSYKEEDHGTRKELRQSD